MPRSGEMPLLPLVSLLATAALLGCAATHKAETTPTQPSSIYVTDGAPAARPVSDVTASMNVSATREDSSDVEPESSPVMQKSFESASGQASGAAPAPTPSAVAVARTPDRLVVEGWVRVEVDDVVEVTRALRERVNKAGGRILTEQLEGAAESWHASLSVRLPPEQVDAVLAWLEDEGHIASKRLQATDVSKTLFDQELAIENLRLTLDRLRKLYEQGGLQTAQILEIEREMTRIRGEIERIAGEKRFLEDRVALATLSIDLAKPGGPVAVMSPRVKLYPGPRLAWLHRFAAGSATQDRVGGGVAVHLGVPRLSLELDVFGDPDDDGPDEAAALVTFGYAMYSDLMGRGLRRWINPYIGVRAGYGHLDDNAFVVQGDLGVELFKAKYVLLDANLRAGAFLGGEQIESALIGALSAVVAF